VLQASTSRRAPSPSPSSSSSSARACLEHLCRALTQLGVGVVGGGGDGACGALTAETLRRAKFNHASAAAPLWRALHDLLIVGLAGYPEPATAVGAIAHVRGVGREGSGVGESNNNNDNDGDGDGDGAATEEDEACARLARHYLTHEGYPHADELAHLPARDGPSRPLLVALAWLVRRPTERGGERRRAHFSLNAHLVVCAWQVVINLMVLAGLRPCGCWRGWSRDLTRGSSARTCSRARTPTPPRRRSKPRLR
jgi:hypothetical protein